MSLLCDSACADDDSDVAPVFAADHDPAPALPHDSDDVSERLRYELAADGDPVRRPLLPCRSFGACLSSWWSG
jgi:hypothetical protein